MTEKRSIVQSEKRTTFWKPTSWVWIFQPLLILVDCCKIILWYWYQFHAVLTSIFSLNLHRPFHFLGLLKFQQLNNLPFWPFFVKTGISRSLSCSNFPRKFNNSSGTGIFFIFSSISWGRSSPSLRFSWSIIENLSAALCSSEIKWKFNQNI